MSDKIDKSILIDSKMKQVFEEARTLLRGLECGQLSGSGYAGRLSGLARALDLLDGWPDAEYREHYMPRIKTQAQRADVAERMRIGIADATEPELTQLERKLTHGCVDTHCPDCDGSQAAKAS